MNSLFSERLDRRTALKWMATAAASATLMPRSFAQSAPVAGGTIVEAYSGPGYGTDPDLMRDYKPGDWWPLTFDDHQRRTAALLCGLIIPADSKSPSAADLKVHDFIDEWISSPYPDQAGDRVIILEGLVQLDQISEQRNQAKFVDLAPTHVAEICDLLAVMPEADELGAESPVAEAVDLRPARRFFKRFRELTAGGFFTTPEGMKDIGYTGNVPLPAFPKPPADLLARLGLPADV
jgi:hypothetical protein